MVPFKRSYMLWLKVKRDSFFRIFAQSFGSSEASSSSRVVTESVSWLSLSVSQASLVGGLEEAFASAHILHTRSPLWYKRWWYSLSCSSFNQFWVRWSRWFAMDESIPCLILRICFRWVYCSKLVRLRCSVLALFESVMRSPEYYGVQCSRPIESQ